jgi:CBS domain-containing protein
VVAENRPAASTRVAEVMTTPVLAVRRDTPLEECRTLMSQRRVRHLPVIEAEKLLGLVSTGDILADEVSRQQSTIEYLHEYIHGPGMGLTA